VRVLLDTCVLSEITRPYGEERVRDSLAAIRSEDLFISVVTIGVIAQGLALMASGGKKDALASFLLSLEQDYRSRILSIDVEVARIWGEVTARARERGKRIPPAHALIAATAIRHGLHVMTRNVCDFAETGALILNPWDEA